MPAVISSAGDSTPAAGGSSLENPPPAGARRWVAACGGPALIAAVALGMAAWTWGTWPDVLVDFGREYYVPWRLASGDVLYRDVAIFNGPLSQYFNSLCFRLFGASLRTLVFCNLALLGLFLALLYYALRQVARRWVVTAACVVFVLLFAFAEHMIGGNFDYVCPYAHEMTHGLMLSLLAVVTAWPAERHRLLWATLSGLVLGLAFLTKAEVFLSGLVAAPAALLLGLWFERPGWRDSLTRCGCFLTAFLLPPVVSFLWLASAMPGEQALRGTLGSWGAMLRHDIAGSPFHLMGTGFDRPLSNALAMLGMAGFYALILVPAAMIGLRPRESARARVVIAGGVFAVVAGLLWCLHSAIDWSGIARPLPLMLALTILAVGVNFRQRRGEEAARRRFVQQITLLIFALVLLSKMVLYARIWQYGFVLAMPATLLAIAAALDWVPAWMDRRGGQGEVFAAAAAALLFVTALVYLEEQANMVGIKKNKVGAGANAFLADERGIPVRAALAEISRRSSPTTTLAVLPEGALLNCLTGLHNSTPYCTVLPVETLLFGPDRVLEAFRTHPPNLIFIWPQDLSAYGCPGFGGGYSRPLGEWINANYRPVWGEGEPFCLLERRGSAKNLGRARGSR
jgi:4-amino-4-deoxy-L-arabinose transferase-like glycosyltransferase